MLNQLNNNAPLKINLFISLNTEINKALKKVFYFITLGNNVITQLEIFPVYVIYIFDTINYSY